MHQRSHADPVRGRGPHYLHILTVVGRISGRERCVPVDVMDVGGTRYIVAPYGHVNWVRNLRAAGTASLRRGSDVRECGALEVTPVDARTHPMFELKPHASR